MLMLDERIIQELKILRQEQEDAGKLPSRQQLEQYYQNFRDEFAPEILNNLDGEALLYTMHGPHDPGSKDRLSYWLEYKNDNEFSTTLFGGIGGGSAHKFGLFRRKETGVWTTGTPQNPEDISVEQAIEIARRHRSQLTAGTELLASLPEGADDATYERLQQNLGKVAPDIYEKGWAHKYFCLLYPKKLDDYHNYDYQAFHLIKLLQVPSQIKGMYSNAGRFIAIARMLDIPINWLTSLLNIRNGSPHRYWRIGIPSTGGKSGEYWKEMCEGGFCAIGWNPVGDLSDVSNDKVGKQIIADRVRETHPDYNDSTIKKAAAQISAFRYEIAPHNLVLVSAGKTVLGIGRVVGKYMYDPASVASHHRPVEWLSLDEWDLYTEKTFFAGNFTSVHRMKQFGNLIEAEKRILDAASGGSNESSFQETISVAARPMIALQPLTGIAERIQVILERKGQVILYGPPGTGKTYWAEYTACELAARTRFSKSFEQLTPVEKEIIWGNSQIASGNVRLCCFHPSYGYEDFLEGLRPIAHNGSMQFIPRDGIFKQLCQDARKAPQEKFYLVIDEINRGDIPRIFGELLTVLEKDKRNKSILLPLTNKPFQVPPNVYLIGTMNTADRSIALLDAALRRRFSFIELMPNSALLGDTILGGVPIGLWLDELNRRICTSVGPDARNLQVGHAYFLERGRPISDFSMFARVLQDDIVPLLEEYCYEDYHKLEQVLGKDLVDKETQQVRYELFDPAQQANLAQALLAANPDITTSSRAVRAEKLAEEAEAEQEELIGEDENA